MAEPSRLFRVNAVIIGQIVQANAMSLPFPAGYFHTIVTSPPYLSLRTYQGTAVWKGGDPLCTHDAARKKTRFDYKLGEKQKSNRGSDLEIYKRECPSCGARRIDAQLGAEPLHDCLAWTIGAEPCGNCFVCNTRTWAAEAWRVLRSDGTLWLNLGDSYNGSGGAGGDYAPGGLKDGQPLYSGRDIKTLKHKDLMGIPWRCALALQADGWYLRSEIIWSKVAPMPESVTDRPGRKHEHIFLLSKSEKYFFDHQAVKEKAKSGGVRNLRDIWEIKPETYSGKHYATFPSEIPRRAILAGTSEKGCCAICGAPWVRILEKPQRAPDTDEYNGKNLTENSQAAGRRMLKNMRAARAKNTNRDNPYPQRKTLGFEPSCTCNAGDPIPCRVLDPFSGSGTTWVTCQSLGRNFFGVELSGEYVILSRTRAGVERLATWGNGGAKIDGEEDHSDLPLFKPNGG